LLVAVAVAVVSTGFINTNGNNNVFITVDALFLMTSSHHRRRAARPTTSSSSSSSSTTTTTASQNQHTTNNRGNAGGRFGRITDPSPSPESNTDHRIKTIKSPLLIFYGMVVGGDERRRGEGGRGRGGEGEGGANDKDNGLFSRIIQQKRRLFSQRQRKICRQQNQNQNHLDDDGVGIGYTPISVLSKTKTKTTPATATATATATSTSTSTSSSKRTNNSTRRTRPPPMIQVTDIQQYKDEVVDSKDSAIIVVRFYATWCKACKSIEGNYHRLGQEFPSDVVKFVEVPLMKDNAYLHKGLNIPSLPYAHIYYNNDCHNDDNELTSTTCTVSSSSSSFSASTNTLVEELKINKNQFSNFRRIIRSYANRECEVYYSTTSPSSPYNNNNNKDDVNNNNDNDVDEGIINVLSTSPHHHKSNDDDHNAKTTTTSKRNRNDLTADESFLSLL
jgi:thiol-disulfide isomerase/thioredoxin